LPYGIRTAIADKLLRASTGSIQRHAQVHGARIFLLPFPFGGQLSGGV
jgi:hypothetical protein